MSKPLIVIADMDTAYLAELENKFLVELGDRAELEIISDPEYFEQFFSNPVTAEIVAVNENLYTNALQRQDIQNLFILSEHQEQGRTEELSVSRVYKYYGIKELYNELTYKSQERLEGKESGKRETTIIALYSAIGGTGKTSLSVGLAECLAKKHKRILYVNTEAIQAFFFYLSDKSGMPNEGYRAIKEDAGHIYQNIRSFIRKEGFSYIPPFLSTLDARNLSYDIYLNLIRGARESKEYDFIIVDIEAGYKSVELMKEHVKKTMRPEVLGGLGGFSGAFSLSTIKDMEEPVLLSGTDGCGTKVKLAFLMDKHDTIGIDAVAMCVNDIACSGGEPLFFLDYIACGKNYPEKIATIVSGVAEGCKQSGCALVGGETAEHPGLMPEDEYDLAGFAVGVVDRKDIITGEGLKDGDVLIGMASTGVHSNGFSLVRKIFKMDKETLNTYHEELGTTLGEALLAPTRIYVKALKAVKDAGVTVKACSHITGGGFYENIPRMLIDGKRAVVEKNSYPVPPIFKMMAREGNVEEQMMYNTYNMGLGMIVAVDPADVDKTMEAMKSAGDTPYVVGKIIDGEKGVDLV